MEIKMKYILGVVSLYFFVTITSAQAAHQEPLCELRSMLTNETFYAQLLNSVLQGKKGALECIAGCIIYNIDRFLGAALRKMLPLPYNFISTCITEGINKRNTCSILPCLLNTASSALNLMDAMGIHLPFHLNDLLKNIIEHQLYNKYEVANSEGQQPPQEQQHQQQIYQLQQVPTPPPPPPPTPKPTTPSAAYPLKSFGLLNICTAIIISKFIL